MDTICFLSFLFPEIFCRGPCPVAWDWDRFGSVHGLGITTALSNRLRIVWAG